MEEGSQPQENLNKYICKICRKSCTSGRFLGGHMRLHLPLALKHKNIDFQEPSKNSAINPKKCDKTQCEKCGKEFGSMRAMFGHMKCHSKKPRRAMISNGNDGHLPELKSLCHVRRKRSVMKEKIGPNCEEEEEANVAECLIMLSRGDEYGSNYDEVSEFER